MRVPGGGPGIPVPALFLPLLPALLAPIAAIAGLASGNAILLPVLATAAVYPVYAALILRGRMTAAAAAAILWAASLSATIVLVAARDPGAASAAVLNGEPYRAEMFDFIASGRGRESDPGRFVPQHLLHLAAFGALTVASGGLLGLALGAVLVGYMSFYVGALAAGPEPLRAALLGWPPWAILRVAGFIVLGTVLARPLLARLGRRPQAPFAPGRWVAAGAVLLLLDLALKALLASRWAVLLRPCLGGVSP